MRLVALHLLSLLFAGFEKAARLEAFRLLLATMLRPLILCLGLALLGLGSAQSGGSRANNTFIYPPPKGQGPNLKIGQTITARWSSNFTEINLVLWTDFTGSNGMQSIIRLLCSFLSHLLPPPPQRFTGPPSC